MEDIFKGPKRDPTTGRLLPGKYHSYSKLEEYHIWRTMIYRCYNKNDKKYAHYGGRGIRVCIRWNVSFRMFLKDMGKRTSINHSIERINNNGNYHPNNCKWATREEQGSNTKRTRMLTYKGRTKTIPQWAETIGLPYKTIQSRMYRKWPIKFILSPKDFHGNNLFKKPIRIIKRRKQWKIKESKFF